MNHYNECRACGSTDIKQWLKLPDSPIANALFAEANNSRYTLELNFCENCGHMQLSSAPEPEGVFSTYKYRSGVSATFRNHFDAYASKVNSMIRGNELLEIGSNDAYLLSKFKAQGWNVIGVEPSENLVEDHSEKLVPLHKEFFSTDFVKKYMYQNRFDVVCANNVLAHIPNILDLMQGIYDCLRPGGLLVAECGDQKGITGGQYLDNVYHEHLDYYTPYSFSKLCERVGLKVKEVEEIGMHGVSFRAYVYKEEGPSALSKESTDMLGLANSVQQKIETRKETINNLLNNRQFIAYGSAAKAVTSLYTLGIIDKLIGVVDDNPLKQNCYFPGTEILIRGSDSLVGDELIVVTAWNVFEDIKAKLLEKGHSGEIICMP